MASFTEENYLKAIYKLSERNSIGVSTNAIAEKINTKAASVTDMLKRLSDKKLINYKRYQGVKLTSEGKRIAINIIRKHRLWEVFLVEKLNFKWDEVHDIAEQLEHIDSVELIKKLDEFLDSPKFDPHGDPIPDVNGKFLNHNSKPCSEALLETKYILTGVIDHSSEFLQYLDKINLSLGAEIIINEQIDFDKSLNITINKKQKQFISHQVAKNILISEK